MNNPVKVEQFIRSVFEVYGLDYAQYFSVYTDDDTLIELPMVTNGELDLTLVSQAAEVLGENTEDLISLNNKVVAKWQNRFPYIEKKQAFLLACERSNHDNDYDAMRLFDAIWDVKHPRKSMQYDHRDISNRMVALLKEFDESVPGTYHPTAKIQHLHIETKHFCHYEEMEQLMTSFFEMTDRVKTLFFKALDEELSAEEIREYNIIVSTLGVQDRYIPQEGELHYNRLRKLAPVYKKEALDNFFDYVILSPQKTIAPWRCIEFVQNRNMVQAYVNILPAAKKAMREYAMGVANFKCSFAWSDATPLAYTAVDDDSIEELGRMVDFIHIRDQYGGLEPTFIYVPKTKEELGNDLSYANTLKSLTSPVTKGGLSLPPHTGCRTLDITKMATRIAVMGGNRYD